jgi:ureidoacrylate peracid hydrolase
MSDSGGPDSAIWYKDFALTLKREHPDWEGKFTFRDTWGSEVIDQLRPHKGDIISEKMRMTGFYQTNLDTILKTYNLKYLVTVGVATNGCVEATLRDAYYLGYFPILVSDATMNIGPSITQEATEYNIEALYGWVVTVKDCIAAINRVGN